ncbi:hypothetical protein Tco_0307967 [Tanacetum coccineum]
MAAPRTTHSPPYTTLITFTPSSPPPPSLSSSSPLHPHRNHHTDTTTPSRHPQGCVWALSRTTRMRMVWVVLGTKGACGVQPRVYSGLVLITTDEGALVRQKNQGCSGFDVKCTKGVHLVEVENNKSVFGLATGVFGLTNLPRGCVWCRGLAARGAFGLSENAKGAFGLAQDQRGEQRGELGDKELAGRRRYRFPPNFKFQNNAQGVSYLNSTLF